MTAARRLGYILAWKTAKWAWYVSLFALACVVLDRIYS